jgi:hypothetical protein
MRSMSDPFEGHLPRTMAVLFPQVTMNQPMRSHFTQSRSGESKMILVQLDDNGFNGTRPRAAAEDKIY